MVELGRCFRLAPQPAHLRGAEGAARTERLERDEPTELQVPGLVDDAEAAAAHLAHELEAAHDLARQELLLPGVDDLGVGSPGELLEQAGEGVCGGRRRAVVADGHRDLGRLWSVVGVHSWAEEDILRERRTARQPGPGLATRGKAAFLVSE